MKTKLKNNKSNYLMYIAIGIGLIAILTVKLIPGKSENTNTQKPIDNVVEITLNEDGNMAIPLSEVTQDATFYRYNNDGLDMEVFAIKATDGSIRTAFNTCQVCFGSGRGYYKQEGDKLVCQNCGNQFSADDVELIKGGCNPVPISAEEKDVTDSEILISKAFLDEYKSIFENWSR